MANVTPKQVYQWKHNPEFMAEYDRVIKEQWADAVKIAKKTMVDLAQNGDRQAAQYILDTNGFKPTEKIDVNAEVNTIRVEITD